MDININLKWINLACIYYKFLMIQSFGFIVFMFKELISVF